MNQPSFSTKPSGSATGTANSVTSSRAAQRVVLAQQPGEEVDGERADRLVRVRHADEQRRPAAVADGEELDGPSLGRRAHGLETGDPGELGDERTRTGAQLVEREELAVVGDAGEAGLEQIHGARL